MVQLDADRKQTQIVSNKQPMTFNDSYKTIVTVRYNILYKYIYTYAQRHVYVHIYIHVFSLTAL